MGIPGLSSFLKTYFDRYNETLYIHNTFVVIDGNNLIFFLNVGWNLTNSHLVGGDPASYAREVRSFFEKLKECKIRPIVIFDGAYEGEKWTTVYSRFRKTVSTNMRQSYPSSSYRPVALSTIFKEILKEQNILNYQTLLEADDTLALVARRLKCPILSCDSDFFIYPDIQNILLSSITFSKVTPPKNKLINNEASPLPTNESKNVKIPMMVAKVLSLKQLCKSEFNFDDLKLLPFLPVILGNDRIPSSTFSKFNSGRSLATKKKRFTTVFKWIGNQKEFSTALKTVLESVKEKERENLRVLVGGVLKNYRGEGGEKIIWHLIQKDLKNLNISFDDEKEDELSEEVLNPFDYEIPEWFLISHLKSSINSTLFQFLHNNFLFLYPQVEMSSLEPSSSLSIDLIRLLSALLTGPSTFKLLTRNGKQPKIIQMPSLDFLPNFGPVPTLIDPHFKNNSEKLLNSFFELSESEIKFVYEWPSPIRLIICLLIYFFKKTKKISFQNTNKPIRSIAVGVILCYLYPIIKLNKKTTNSSVVADSSDKINNLVQKQSLTPSLNSFYSKYSELISFTKKSIKNYEIGYMYHYSQFKNLLIYGIRVSSLIGCPFRLPKVHYLNSHLIYRVCENVNEVFGGKIPEFLNRNFGGIENKCIFSIFERTLKVFEDTEMIKLSDYVEIEQIDEVCGESEEIRESENSDDSENEVESCDEEETLKLDFETNCSVSNRFSRLKL